MDKLTPLGGGTIYFAVDGTCSNIYIYVTESYRYEWLIISIYSLETIKNSQI